MTTTTDHATVFAAAAETLADGTPLPWAQGEAPDGSCKLDHGQGKLGHGKGECVYRLWDPPRNEPGSIMAGEYVEGASLGSVISVAYDLREADVRAILLARNSAPAALDLGVETDAYVNGTGGSVAKIRVALDAYIASLSEA